MPVAGGLHGLFVQWVDHRELRDELSDRVLRREEGLFVELQYLLLGDAQPLVL